MARSDKQQALETHLSRQRASNEYRDEAAELPPSCTLGGRAAGGLGLFGAGGGGLRPVRRWPVASSSRHSLANSWTSSRPSGLSSYSRRAFAAPASSTSTPYLIRALRSSLKSRRPLLFRSNCPKIAKTRAGTPSSLLPAFR
jgi:hypothetical protein